MKKQGRPPFEEFWLLKGMKRVVLGGINGAKDGYICSILVNV